jgi:hypothetical protein
MDLGARIGWGIVIYAIAFLAWAGMAIYGWTNGIGPDLVEFVVLLVVCIWAGSQLRSRTWKDILPYSIGWAVIFAALDSVFIVPLQSWAWFGGWMTWLTYLLVALFPLLCVYLRNRSSVPHGPWES